MTTTMKITILCAHCGKENVLNIEDTVRTRTFVRPLAGDAQADYRRSVADLKARTVEPQTIDPDRPVSG